MRYPIAIETADQATAFGVVVPDQPGCFSPGDTLDEAMIGAQEAGETRSGHIARLTLAEANGGPNL